RYDEMVTRQTALHLADELWNGYPMQPVLDFVTKHLHIPPKAKIVELGCSVARLIAGLAQQYPDSECWGIDYSYQLLKRAKEYWHFEAVVNIDGSFRGMKPVIARGTMLNNLHFGLAKAEALPFDDASQDVLINSFLLDRLQDPVKGLQEMHRVLKPGGQLIMISPLNFTKLPPTGSRWVDTSDD
ncbi:MAG: methyltransferase domain-containing protein, partial [Bacteroidota bacterium]